MGRSDVVLRVLLIIFAMLLAPGAKAATISTGVTCSLVEAIEAANTNAAVGGCNAGGPGLDTIVVTSNVLLTSVNNGSNGLPIIIEDLAITSSNPDVTPSISRDFTVGVPEFRFLEIGTIAVAPSVTISNIDLDNGRVTGPVAVGGGCILLRNGSLTVSDSRLDECVALGADSSTGPGANAKGGAIYAASGTLSITNTSFSFNSAIGGDTTVGGSPGGTAEGGAIHASGLTSFSLENSSLDSNFAVGGAGISLGGVAKGGGVVFYGLSGSIVGTTFAANAASGGAASNGTSGLSLGGAIVVEGASLTLTDTDLNGNVANGQDSPSGLGGYAFGGGLYSSGSTIDIAGSDVSNNRANGGTGPFGLNGLARGGGLYLLNTTATIDHSNVGSNSISGANPRGAGLAALHESSAAATPLSITHSSFTYNEAIPTFGSARGGGFYQEGDTVTLRNATLSDNSADEGAGLFQDNGTTVMTLSTLSANRANSNGGAVAVDSDLLLSHTVDMTNVTISGNTAGSNGGGLYVTGSPLSPYLTTVNLNNTVVTKNTNGGVYLAEGHTEPVLASANAIIGGQLSGDDCGATGTVVFSSGGGNLESGTSCAFTATSDQQSVADLGLEVLGSYGGETLTHELLPGSPAIDSGKTRVCRREANDKDQRGFARFYDGNGDRDFECDSGAVEYQGLLANPGFEEPLNAASDWSVVASGGGDGRVRSAATPSGNFAFVFQANASLESISQTVPLTGGPGETYALTLLASGLGLTIGERMTVTLGSMSGGESVDTRSCTLAFPAGTFAGPPSRCILTTTGAFDALNVVAGWDGATTGSLTLDALTLTKR